MKTEAASVSTKTLKDVIDEVQEKYHLSGRFDMRCVFDGKKYSLLNLRNYLEPWINSPAYLTANNNIRFIPHGGDGTAATIWLEIGDKEE